MVHRNALIYFNIKVIVLSNYIIINIKISPISILFNRTVYPIYAYHVTSNKLVLTLKTLFHSPVLLPQSVYFPTICSFEKIGIHTCAYIVHTRKPNENRIEGLGGIGGVGECAGAAKCQKWWVVYLRVVEAIIRQSRVTICPSIFNTPASINITIHSLFLFLSMNCPTPRGVLTFTVVTGTMSVEHISKTALL